VGEPTAKPPFPGAEHVGAEPLEYPAEPASAQVVEAPGLSTAGQNRDARPPHQPIGRSVAFGLMSALVSGAIYCAVLAALLSATGQRWGWQFALGVVAIIAIHEMGHVAVLAHYGLARSAPIFVPGFGAFVRVRQRPANVHQDARIGLAGPVWGLAACVGAYAAYLATRASLWAALAQAMAVINLFNLLPVWQLDGGRGFRSLSRLQRLLAVVALVTLWLATREVLLLVLAIAGVSRVASANVPREQDWPVLAAYLILVASFTWLAGIHVPGGGLFDGLGSPGRFGHF
jgi:Zn-dependent protease